MDQSKTPSEALQYWIKKRGITAYQLAHETLLSESRLSQILTGKRRVSTETATILGNYFGTGPEYWLSLQSTYDIMKSERVDSLRSQSFGKLHLGGWVFRCYVSSDGKRLVDERDVQLFLNDDQPSVSRQRLSDLLDSPYYRGSDVLRRKINKPLSVLLDNSIVVYAYEGDTIIDFCRALLDLRRLTALPKWAERYAEIAEMFVASIAKVGITALIDEATGHQALRNKDALQRLLEGYFREEYAAWSKRFPDWFYSELFRLKGWKWNALSTKRPPCVGKFTKDIVYSRLEVGVIAELERKNPLLPNGRRAVKHHQFLSDEIGHPALDAHFYALRGLMRAHHDWDKFYHVLQLGYPKMNESVQLELDDFLPSDDDPQD